MHSLLQDYEYYGSWRKVAKKYGNVINHATLRRYAYGDPVVCTEHRRVLGLIPPPPPRATIYPGTNPKKVIRMLAAIGHDVSYNESELEY